MNIIKVSNRRSNVYLMFLIIFLQGFVFYGPIATLYRQSRGMSMYQIFLIESISWVLMIALEIPWGWFSDRFGYKKTLILSNLVFFISKIIFFAAHSFSMFLLERILLSLALSGISGCDIALIYSSIEEDQAQKVFGRYSACGTAGLLLAAFMSSPMIKKSMSFTAFCTILPYGIAVVLTLFLKDIERPTEKPPSLIKSFKSAFYDKRIIAFVISAALMNEVVQAATVFLNQAQYLRSGITIKYFGIILAGVQLVRLSSAKAYTFYEKIGHKRGLYVVYIGMTLGCVFLIISTNPVLTLLCICGLAGGIALISPASADIENKAITTGDRATILSIYAMLGDLTAAFINVGIGRAADISVVAAFKLCTFICIGAVIFLSYYFKKA